MTFYALLSLVPAITATVSLYGMVADPSTIAKQLDSLSGIVPSGGMQIIGKQVRRLAEAPRSGLGFGLVVCVSACKTDPLIGVIGVQN